MFIKTFQAENKQISQIELLIPIKKKILKKRYKIQIHIDTNKTNEFKFNVRYAEFR